MHNRSEDCICISFFQKTFSSQTNKVLIAFTKQLDVGIYGHSDHNTFTGAIVTLIEYEISFKETDLSKTYVKVSLSKPSKSCESKIRKNMRSWSLRKLK